MTRSRGMFSIRHVPPCGFGDELPKAWQSRDHALEGPSADRRVRSRRTAAGGRSSRSTSRLMVFRAVPRTQSHLISGARVVFLESRCHRAATWLSHSRRPSFARPDLVASSALAASGGNADVAIIRSHGDVLEQSNSTITAAYAESRPRRLPCDWPRSTCRRGCRLRHVSSLARAGQVQSESAWNPSQASLTDIYLFGRARKFGAPPPRPTGAPGRNPRDRMARRGDIPGTSISRRKPC